MHFLFLCKSVLPFCEVNFGEDFVHQVTRISSRYQACFKVFNVFVKHYFRSVCISLLVAAGFVLNAIQCPLEYFSNMAVMVEIVSRRVEFSCALSVFV